ncbi:hypothetical protein GCM10023334_127150 [Nonomuraea thailandensis]
MLRLPASGLSNVARIPSRPSCPPTRPGWSARARRDRAEPAARLVRGARREGRLAGAPCQVAGTTAGFSWPGDYGVITGAAWFPARRAAKRFRRWSCRGIGHMDWVDG